MALGQKRRGKRQIGGGGGEARGLPPLWGPLAALAVQGAGPPGIGDAASGAVAF